MLVPRVTERRHVLDWSDTAGQRVVPDDSVREPLGEVIEVNFHRRMSKGATEQTLAGNGCDRSRRAEDVGGEGRLELGSGCWGEEGGEDGVDGEDNTHRD